MLKKIFREFRQMWSWYGVPFVSTPDDKLRIILNNIELKKGEVFIDIGCGDGRVVEAISEKFPSARGIWYESSKYPYKQALTKRETSKCEYELYNRDIFTVNLSEVDVIHIYMVPYILPKLTKKIQSECKIWTKIYIQSHEAKNWIPEKVVALSEKNNLYIYTLK